ncbi:flagellar basal body P-ring formation chaperone FlgA [Aestuariibius sp. 2305UL40-4]|uniref:flagellar basal body P-ring formation chaperone FlgA n=1 Tax=Aestuariibius violaceus TaxID=3234132 RepID=UPI00345E1E2A
MIRTAFVLFLLGGPAVADTIVATRTIRPQSIITSGDIERRDGVVSGAIDNVDLVVGMEARSALYPGRPILFAQIGPPAIVERNQILTLVFQEGALTISTEGRALGRGAAGEKIRVMNLASRNTVTALIGQDGTAYVSN